MASGGVSLHSTAPRRKAMLTSAKSGVFMRNRIAAMASLSILASLWATHAFADDPNTTNKARLRHELLTSRDMNSTTRSMGVANNMAATASGTSAVYHNPAGIASAVMYAMDLSYTYDNDASGHGVQLNLVDMKSNSYVGAGLGVHYQYASPGDLSRHYVQARLGVAVPLAGNILSLGLGAVYNYMEYHGKELVSQFTLDTGLIVRPLDWISLGLSVQNLIVGDYEAWMPRMISAGIAVGSLEWGLSVMFETSFDLSADKIDETGAYGVGVEYSLKKLIPIRLGYRYEMSDGSDDHDEHVLAAGLGYRHSAGTFGLDLAYQHYFNDANDLFTASVNLYF